MKHGLIVAIITLAAVAGAGCGGNSGRHHADQTTGSAMRGDVVARGKGEIGFVATAPGRVTVRNTDKNKVVVTRDIRQGDIVTVRPGRDEVLLNNSRIFNENMEGNDTHTITFNPTSPSNSSR